MLTAQGRSALVSCVAMASALAASGCAVGGKSFAIDSNSRVPFFGLELKERKSKDVMPSYRSISTSESDRSRLQPALGTGKSGTNDIVRRKESRPSDLRVTSLSDETPVRTEHFAKGSQLLSMESRPLPMKEIRGASEPLDRTGVALDFQ